MKVIKLIFFLAMVSFLMSDCYAFAGCEDFNPPKPDCLHCCYVDINTETYSGDNDNFVGDSFTYFINFTNVGTQKIETPVEIKITFPSKQTATNRFNLSLEPLENIIYQPMWGGGSVEESNAWWYFTLSGEYWVEVKTNKSIMLAYFGRGCNVKQSYGHMIKSFDVMPRWQKEWKDYQKEYLNETMNLSKGTAKINSSIEWLTVIMASMTFFILVLTVFILVLTVVNTYIVYKSKKD